MQKEDLRVFVVREKFKKEQEKVVAKKAIFGELLAQNL